jgi:integrase
MKVTIRSVDKHGENKWCVDWRPRGSKRQRRFFNTKQEALALRQQIEGRIAGSRNLWIALTPKEQDQLLALLVRTREKGISLEDLAEQSARVPLGQERKTLAEAIEATIIAKSSANRRPDYLLGLQQYLHLFARGRENRYIDEITGADIEQWFARRKEAASTRASNLGRLSALFALAWRRNWVTENPCKRVERVTVEQGVPRILSAEEAGRILELARSTTPRALAWFSLTLLAGVRPEEADRIEWSAIDLDRGIARIDAAASKVRQRRIVHLMPAAIEWLRLAMSLKAELPLNYSTRRRDLRSIREAIGWKEWPQDILRHSCASYWLAETQDAARVAHELGNSAGILLRHYRELVTRAEAQRFWALRPPA